MSCAAAETLAASFAPTSLDELNRDAALRERLDVKYIVPWSTVERLFAQLGDDYRALEIDGRRVFTYETIYFDSPTLHTYREHVQRRRKRYKTRSRHYVESGLYQFEVKLKGARGETIKRRLEREPALHEAVDPHARQFLENTLRELYGTRLSERFEPTLRSEYRRLTLASGDGEKLTCDFDLVLSSPAGTIARLAPDYAILESKSARSRARADHLLHRLGARPAGCSKYCLGIALTHSSVKANAFKRILRTYFEPIPAAVT